MSVLQAVNLSIGYTHKKIQQTLAKNLSFELPSSALIALVGMNGVGKTTLLKTLTGSVKPIVGEVRIDHESLEDISKNALAQKLSVVLTEKMAMGSLKVEELVALGRQPYTNWLDALTEKDKWMIAEALKITETTQLKDKNVNELSDGQLQKVFIARAIAQDTPIIMLDEPSTHLDLYHKVQLFRLLKSLSIQAQKCILFSTHDLDLALQVSDQVMVLTSDSFYLDTPEKLIENNVFDQFFDDKQIVFDAQNRRFNIQLE